MSRRRSKFFGTLCWVFIQAGCGGAPWFLGAPLTGRPSIPSRSQVVTVAEHRRNAEAAAANGNRVAELAELQALAARDSLRSAESRRLVELLLARAADWIALGRPIALTADLRAIVSLAPGRKAALARPLRAAERAAGDQWLAMGELARAEAEYRDADRDGASGMDFRFRAAWDAAVGDLETATLARAITELPARALAPFSAAYLEAGGTDAAVLYRAWKAARTQGPRILMQKLETLPEASGFSAALQRESELARAREAARGRRPLHPAPAPPTEAQLEAGASLARRLIPAARNFPELLTPGERTRAWAARLIEEDPTSPDSFELSGLIDARAGRMDSAAQKLEELAYFSADRAVAATRVAQIWEQVGEGRRACAAWETAARLGADDDPHWCAFLRCAARNPGAVEQPGAERYVAARAPGLSCEERAPAVVPASTEQAPAGSSTMPSPEVLPPPESTSRSMPPQGEPDGGVVDRASGGEPDGGAPGFGDGEAQESRDAGSRER